MKKNFLFALAALLLFAACEKKPAANQESLLVGRWLITDIFYQLQSGGIFHEDLEGANIYDFQQDHKLVQTSIADGDTDVVDNLSWSLLGDTLYLMSPRDPDQEPGMPGIMQILKLTEQEMRWCYLIVGDTYIDLKRL